MRSGAAAAALGGLRGNADAHGAPAIVQRGAVPVVIASANGNRYTHDGNETCVARAFRLMTAGEDVLDALIAGVNIVELDPKDTSVGYGGLPNADGVVQLDACCMHGPRKQAGGVAALEGVRTPSKVAHAVMQQTDHHLLVGAGAQQFARQMGFTIEDDLNTETSRARWLDWKRRIDPEHFLDPDKRASAGAAAGLQMVREDLIDPEHYFGTINCNGVNARGEVCGVTTTSGLAWKIPGRVGDSPVLGAGLYVDGDIGAAGSTGRGEANLFGLCSYLVVEQMRLGKHPKDAGMEALRRIKANTIEKRLLDTNGNPKFQVNFYVVNKAGDFAGVALYESSFAVCTANGPEIRKSESLLGGKPDR